MKRLEEDVLQRKLFERDGRQVRLTPEGQVLLGYARRILKLHSEVFNTLREPHMVGLVRIGTPDDYVMRFLPGILKQFSKAYPLIQIEMHCEASTVLMQRRDLALTVISREPGNDIGELLRTERVVWRRAVFLRGRARRPATGDVRRRLPLHPVGAHLTGYRRAQLSPGLQQHQRGGDPGRGQRRPGSEVSMEASVTDDLRRARHVDPRFPTCRRESAAVTHR